MMKDLVPGVTVTLGLDIDRMEGVQVWQGFVQFSGAEIRNDVRRLV